MNGARSDRSSFVRTLTLILGWADITGKSMRKHTKTCEEGVGGAYGRNQPPKWEPGQNC